MFFIIILDCTFYLFIDYRYSFIASFNDVIDRTSISAQVCIYMNSSASVFAFPNCNISVLMVCHCELTLIIGNGVV